LRQRLHGGGVGLARTFRHAQLGLVADLDGGHLALRHVDVHAQAADVGHHEQLAARAPPTLISAPTSVLRAVTTPSNGATSRV
jgi:hypothetical protein